MYFWEWFQCNVYKKLVLNLHFFTAFLVQKIDNFSIAIFTFFSLLKKQVKVVNLALISCKNYTYFCSKNTIFALVNKAAFWTNWKSKEILVFFSKITAKNGFSAALPLYIFAVHEPSPPTYFGTNEWRIRTLLSLPK